MHVIRQACFGRMVAQVAVVYIGFHCGGGVKWCTQLLSWLCWMHRQHLLSGVGVCACLRVDHTKTYPFGGHCHWRITARCVCSEVFTSAHGTCGLLCTITLMWQVWTVQLGVWELSSLVVYQAVAYHSPFSFEVKNNSLMTFVSTQCVHVFLSRTLCVCFLGAGSSFSKVRGVVAAEVPYQDTVLCNCSCHNISVIQLGCFLINKKMLGLYGCRTVFLVSDSHKALKASFLNVKQLNVL